MDGLAAGLGLALGVGFGLGLLVGAGAGVGVFKSAAEPVCLGEDWACPHTGLISTKNKLSNPRLSHRRHPWLRLPHRCCIAIILKPLSARRYFQLFPMLR
jgi:hypothetical protein